MSLRRRTARTVSYNVGIVLVPWALYHATHAVVLWGAFRGYWAVNFV